MFFTFLISIVDGLKALCESLEIEYFGWLQSILNLYDNILPFYGVGLGWVIPFIVITVITSLIARVIR